ncbi:hypothetical protein [Rhizobium anhuiense]|uniref:hypothetical protein n=1 Tax=Rhizobium anhuiense TaxID=1184720 RepID=UPI0013DEB6F5|nr:hypothetical protein [Rhizobium anhuiense]
MSSRIGSARSIAFGMKGDDIRNCTVRAWAQMPLTPVELLIERFSNADIESMFSSLKK